MVYVSLKIQSIFQIGRGSFFFQESLGGVSRLKHLHEIDQTEPCAFSVSIFFYQRGRCDGVILFESRA